MGSEMCIRDSPKSTTIQAHAPEWWYSSGGEQRGPVTAGALASLLASGEVSLSTWVYQAGTSDWQELSRAQARLPTVSAI